MSNKAIDPLNVFVSLLPLNFPDSELYNLFSKCGTVESAHVMINAKTGVRQRYGFVKFKTAEDASRAIAQLDGFRVENDELVVRHANTMKERATYPPIKTIRVVGINQASGEVPLTNLFSKFGKVVQIRILPDYTAKPPAAKLAYLRFATIAASKAAVSHFSNGQQTECGNLTVEFAKTDLHEKTEDGEQNDKETKDTGHPQLELAQISVPLPQRTDFSQYKAISPIVSPKGVSPSSQSEPKFIRLTTSTQAQNSVVSSPIFISPPSQPTSTNSQPHTPVVPASQNLFSNITFSTIDTSFPLIIDSTDAAKESPLNLIRINPESSLVGATENSDKMISQQLVARTAPRKLHLRQSRVNSPPEPNFIQTNTSSPDVSSFSESSFLSSFPPSGSLSSTLGAGTLLDKGVNSVNSMHLTYPSSSKPVPTSFFSPSAAVSSFIPSLPSSSLNPSQTSISSSSDYSVFNEPESTQFSLYQHSLLDTHPLSFSASPYSPEQKHSALTPSVTGQSFPSSPLSIFASPLSPTTQFDPFPPPFPDFQATRPKRQKKHDVPEFFKTELTDNELRTTYP
ncbi:putative RNA recognition domain containing protein [Blattamonas nauphoetae]|uniref:RNA recognition domain containing protein n=1 Tax=Blattamonas nauphoetae TaxID=2049346 RepID=A0ABQ9YAH4_9EUKA|nr:putative RNA recognition domain containing protein [Blattamonas nauphoetae]